MAVEPIGPVPRLPVGAHPSVVQPGVVHPSVVQLRQVGASRSVGDAELVAATAAVVDAVRESVLERRALGGVELGRTQRASVAQEVRNLAAAELQLALGLGITEARVLVTAATSPADLVNLLDTALRSGEASWPLVRAFFERTARLSAEQRMLVAQTLFGSEAALAHEDRLDPCGRLRGEPWGHARFTAALAAEVTACDSADPAAERERRARAFARRRLTLRAHDDGTATLCITGPLVTLTAVHQRYDRAARNLRKAGDERTLDQLRVDCAETMLLYGTITLPTPDATDVNPAPNLDQVGAGNPQDEAVDDVVAPADVEHLARVVNALPLVQLQVIVPLATLSGGFPICARCGTPTDRPPPAAAPSEPGRSPSDPPDPSPAACRQRWGGNARVAEVLGPNPFFITDGHARELALFPGTALHRLVVDPRDGRLVERTITAYRPDADMRRQVVAADVYSRAPGSRLGAHAGELDHVTPYGWAGGLTSETNLALLAKTPHQFKTDGAWQVAINDRRDLTITSVLGQVVTTRMHDYGTYLRTRHPEDLDARRDLANQLVYAALAEHPARRGGGRRDEARISLDWTGRDGATYQGPSPSHPTLDGLLTEESERPDHPRDDRQDGAR